MSDKISSSDKLLKIVWNYPEDLQSHFVSNLIVQHQPGAFVISFFEIWPPAILGDSEEEKKELLKAIDHVDAKCVSRLVVTPEKMKEFVAVMAENLSKYGILIKDVDPGK